MDTSNNPEKTTLLFQDGDHAIYWVGLSEVSAFRCNVYLLVDQDKAWIIDPGGCYGFEQVKSRIEEMIPLDHIDGLILCHQDPDVAASMINWLELKPDLNILTTPRTQVLLPHYGITDYNYINLEENPTLTLPSGNKLRFIDAPFMHFPGAFVTYDELSHYLFSGDIWAALDIDWKLEVTDFAKHCEKMDLFHKDYMASNIAARGFVERIKGLPIEAILPQHGSIIKKSHVKDALEYLKNLRCGTDIIYANLDKDS